MLQRLAQLMLLFISSACLAADAPKVNPRIFDARQRYEAALAKAESQYETSIAEARRTYVRDLDAALTKAMDGRDLDGANAIKSERESILKGASNPIGPLSKSDGAARSLGERLVGTKWKFTNTEERVIFLANGVVESTGWKTPGIWKATSENAVRQQNGGGGPEHIITFQADVKYAMWINQNTGAPGIAIRVE